MPMKRQWKRRSKQPVSMEDMVKKTLQKRLKKAVSNIFVSLFALGLIGLSCAHAEGGDGCFTGTRYDERMNECVSTGCRGGGKVEVRGRCLYRGPCNLGFGLNMRRNSNGAEYICESNFNEYVIHPESIREDLGRQARDVGQRGDSYDRGYRGYGLRN